MKKKVNDILKIRNRILKVAEMDFSKKEKFVLALSKSQGWRVLKTVLESKQIELIIPVAHKSETSLEARLIDQEARRLTSEFIEEVIKEVESVRMSDEINRKEDSEAHE